MTSNIGAMPTSAAARHVSRPPTTPPTPAPVPMRPMTCRAVYGSKLSLITDQKPETSVAPKKPT